MIIDDEPQMVQIVGYAMEVEGWRTSSAGTAREGWQILNEQHCDLVILDVMLPDMSGTALCQRIRAAGEFADTPVIMLTALGETEKRVAGLEAGADDYLAKPFSPRELVLRTRALLRRSGASQETTAKPIVVGEVSVHPLSHAVEVRGRAVDMTETESKLLQALLARPGEVVGVRQLLNEVWETSATQGGRNMVKSTMYRLRKKLEDAGMPPDAIASIRGKGYVWAAM
nr:response regulator transcription factor [Corynebacterium pseudogenitalium]